MNTSAANTPMTQLSYQKGGSYFIDQNVIPRSTTEGMKYASLKIDDWASKRSFFVDEEHGYTLFQASSENNGCHRCSICQDRMRQIGGHTGHVFVQIEHRGSLYQKRQGVPSELTVQGIVAYLGLPVIDAVIQPRY